MMNSRFAKNSRKQTSTIVMLLIFCLSVLITSDLGNMESDLLGEKELSPPENLWSEEDFVNYIKARPQRNYFAHFISKGGFRRCIEIGVQDGRFSEILLHENRNLKEPWMLVLVDPAPTEFFVSRFGQNGESGSWMQKGYLENVNITFEEKFSTDPSLLAKYPDEYFDFVYLDALHSYTAVKTEVSTWWSKVRIGGILAGHDYCNYGEVGLTCNGCDDVPECGLYTREGVESAESKRGRSSNQHDVVRAVQEWIMEHGDDRLAIHHTLENFTRESLAKDGIDYNMVIRRDRNPSWFIYKHGN